MNFRKWYHSDDLGLPQHKRNIERKFWYIDTNSAVSLVGPNLGDEGYDGGKIKPYVNGEPRRRRAYVCVAYRCNQLASHVHPTLTPNRNRNTV